MEISLYALPRPLLAKLRDHAAERLRAWVVIASLALSTSVFHAWAGPPSEVVEHQVKAAFLYKFGAYVEWPEQAFAQPSSPVVIGIIGSDSVAEELMQMSTGRNINGRPVSVKKLAKGDALTGLHILFIARTDSARMATTLAAAKGLSMLVVTETDPPMMQGCVINFVAEKEKVRFDVALPSAELNNIKLSARLLTVARQVIGAPS
jgi:uncharacterized protein DUF4154